MESSKSIEDVSSSSSNMDHLLPSDVAQLENLVYNKQFNNVKSKSVSMDEFTSEESNALQGEGNEHAKEVFFKDSQRHSVPDSSNVERPGDFTGERNLDKSPRAQMEEEEEEKEEEEGEGEGEEEGEEGEGKRKSWTQRATFTLLDIWREKLVGLRRKTLPSSEWIVIARMVSQELETILTETQCKNRIHFLKKKYRTTSVDWEYFRKMDSLAQEDLIPTRRKKREDPQLLALLPDAKEKSSRIEEEKTKGKKRKQDTLTISDLPDLDLSPYIVLLRLRNLIKYTISQPLESLGSIVCQRLSDESQDDNLQNYPYPYPYPWIDQSIEELAKIKLVTIFGEFECSSCKHKWLVSVDWRECYVKIASLMLVNFIFYGDDIYKKWTPPPPDISISCQVCNKKKVCASIIPENWYFVFFTHMIHHVPDSILASYVGSKSLLELSEVPSKRELMFTFYLAMLHQLDPRGGWLMMMPLKFGVNEEQVTLAYNKDTSSVKLNLSMGAYWTKEGKPLVLNIVKQAEQDQTHVKERIPITGLADFNKLSAKLIFGADSPAIQENRIVTVQCLSGTGSLRLGAEFLTGHYHQHTIYIPRPTWGNHPKIFSIAGMSVEYYRYYDPSTRGLDFQGLLEDLNAASAGAVVLLHACAHNPTGVDPTLEQWEQIRQLMRSKALLPFFDSAYQGFASGSLDADAQPVRMFVADGGECFAAQSYAKNMGLYGERVGALSIVCRTADVVSKVESQLKHVIRPMYSSPPIHCASIVATILKNSDMYNEWTIELKEIADRIISMRQQLFDALRAKGTPGDWSHIIKQVGMFTFTGLKTEQVAFITSQFHIYMTSNGRISMASLNSKTVPRLVAAIHAAVT